MDTTARWSLGWLLCGGVKIVGALAYTGLLFSDDEEKQEVVTIFLSLMIGTSLISRIFNEVVYLGHLCVPQREGENLGDYAIRIMSNNDLASSHSLERSRAIARYIFNDIPAEMRGYIAGQPSAVLTMTEKQFHSYHQYDPDIQRLLTGLRVKVAGLDNANHMAKTNCEIALMSYQSMQNEYERDSSALWTQQFQDISGKSWTVASDISTKLLNKLLVAYQGYNIHTHVASL
jgi:hypothetical protein